MNEINNPTASPQKANDSIETEKDSQNCGGLGDKTGLSKKRGPYKRHAKLPSQNVCRGKPKHTLWVDYKRVKIDKRTALGKAMDFLESELVKHVGGVPSVIEKILIDRIVHKTVKCHLYEIGFFENPEQGSRDHYLGTSNSLRLDAIALGVKPRQLPEMGLNEYIKRIEAGEIKPDLHKATEE